LPKVQEVCIPAKPFLETFGGLSKLKLAIPYLIQRIVVKLISHAVPIVVRQQMPLDMNTT